MKKVVSPETVAHLWANQLQDEARNSGNNFYFNGNTIYSYGGHFPIAQHIANKDGEQAILFTTGSYSNTTSNHIGIVRSASNHITKIYCRHINRYTAPDHYANFHTWTKNIESIAKSLLTARKPEKYLSLIAQEYNQAVIYAKFFGLELPNELIQANEISNKEEFIKFNDAKEVRIKQETEKALKAQKLKIAKDLKKWRNFEISSISTRYNEDFIRYNTEKQRIETSQRVEIPLQIAKVFYNTILETINKGGCIDCDYKIMDYSVKEINKDFIQVGCHKITLKEIKTVAKQLNW